MQYHSGRGVMWAQSLSRRCLALAALAMAAVPSTALATGRPVKVAELFTSQGCSSVPPANRNLVALGDRRDLLTLSYSVTYWDYLGWKDTFGREAYTDRQRAYEPSLGHDGPFTPQIVVNGAKDVVGNKAAPLHDLIDTSPAPAATSIDIGHGSVALGNGRAPQGGADVWLVRYRPGVVNVPIARGENAGTVLPVSNVVHDLVRLGSWNGLPVTLAVPPHSAAFDWRTAVLVQARQGGTIVAAATD